jgi:Mannosylglycerate hydrolase MGH1-like glycoside hydrolase domain/Glycosyl hydrolase family 65, C-terminal domain
MEPRLKRFGIAAALPLMVFAAGAPKPQAILEPDSFHHYIEEFNRNDVELTRTYIPDQSAWAWLRDNIPLFESSDKALEEMYYFRWWTFRKHISETPKGFVITEFLPQVPWAGPFNTISCSAAHHFYEGRWLRDRKYLADYARFWFRKGGNPRLYSFAAADALRAWSLVTQDQYLTADLLPELVANYQAWESSHQDPNGLFWQVDDRDGMEFSIGGSGYRPTINSYQFGDAMAISEVATWAWPHRDDLAVEYREKAEKLRILVETKLWDETQSFYETLPRGGHSPAGVRELVGYIPWFFDLPNPGREAAWKQLMDPQGFRAPYGLTTAERRSPRFMFANPHECLWNGPSWPFATSQTLTAMANLLNHYRQVYVSKADYLELLRTYARSQHLKLPDGKVIPFIDEDLNPDTGEWIARDQLLRMPPAEQRKKGGADRGRDYNHSTFNDLIITGLVGLRPRADDWLEVNPLIPEGALEYFCLDRVRYRDRDVTILYDRTGTHYKRGPGLHVYANGREIGSALELAPLMAKLPSSAGGWVKYAGNPLIGGGKLGTVFDITVLREDGKYRMWGSWRPKGSLALFESKDGIHWSDPTVVLAPNPATGWEDNINRPSVLRRADGYHLWYTGQAHGKSWIGYATSPDGVVWTRRSDKPVLSPELPWEKTSVMCPNVLWDEKTKLFQMWYSGGDQYEPDAIGYATSPDGLHWTKHPGNPVLKPDPRNVYEQYKVTAAQVLHWKDWYYAVYIGFRDTDHAQIAIARSRDGMTNWERHPLNPIIRPGQDDFDQDACYKPYMVFDGKQWLLWYNGRHGSLEQIALALHAGEDLGFTP